MRKLATIAAIAVMATIAACAAIHQRGYIICNDLAANTTCPDNTANVVVGM